MTIDEYLGAVKERLLTDPIIVSFQILRERATTIDGHLRARLALTNLQRLDFSEYVQRAPNGEIQVITYSYHWSDEQDRLIRRWDNTPHFPKIPNFPHHLHQGVQDTVEPSAPMSIFAVLDEIRRHG